jgi:uncharacterized protein
MFRLGVAYADGLGVAQDWAQAALWYEKAAAAGHVGALAGLGDCFLMTPDKPQDVAQAVFWWEKAATAGFTDAQYNLYKYFLRGSGVPQDTEKAVRWLKMAAAAGHAEALRTLGALNESEKA